MLSRVGSASFMSFLFAPPTVTPRGIPFPSTSRLLFVPDFALSVGFGPVLFPPERRLRHRAMREAEILSLRTKGRGKAEAEYLLSSLRSLFHETKSELKEHPPPNRKLHDKSLRKLRYVLSKRYTEGDVLGFVAKLKSASKNLFTFTLYRGVEPTNNHAERELRESIVHRKIRGQLKSEKGIMMFSRLMTAVSTWKLQDLNPFAEFKKCL